ncbi:MAG: type II secretion system F family protein [Amaricoccus sp.]|uniref:type II secretion system F family protein n=1 Tax=Amaricoccus sp. TaxID=1872485 RepID=UPI0039E352ED
MSGNLIVAASLFLASALVAIGLGLFALTVVLKAQAEHRKRLARVGRRRLSGRLDLEDARLSLVKPKEEQGALVGVTHVLARFLPLLEPERLRAKFRRAGLGWRVTGFVGLSVALGLVLVLALALVTGRSILVLLVPCQLVAMLLMDGLVGFLGNRMSGRFMKQLPDAMDTIIRGIRSGLPVIECIASVGQEFDEPVGSHFRTISERVALGEPLEAALWRVARVIDRPEMDFLAIAISIQMETGGSLSDALGNLADLLRARERMKLKIKAISSEAKASACIIGALPFLMLGLLLMMSPDYVMKLFTDPRGHMMLAGGLASISIGGFVMWRMTQFEILRRRHARTVCRPRPVARRRIAAARRRREPLVL